MTNSNNRLDRIERILESTVQRQQDTENIVQSNSRLLQAMLEQRATDRLEHEERMIRLEETVIRLDHTVARLARIEAQHGDWVCGANLRTPRRQNRMLANMDEDRPTMLL